MNIKELQFEGGRGLVVDEGRIGDWSQTWTGNRQYPLDPRPQDIALMDIIMSLGNKCRYNGQCRFYSVAEHSVLVSRMVPEKDAFAGLCHDFAEPYTGDMTRPMKRAVGKDNSYFKIESDVWTKAIAPKFGLPMELPESVHIADTQICGLEKAVLHPRSQKWSQPFPIPKGIEIRCLQPLLSQLALIERWCQLTGDNRKVLQSQLMYYVEEDMRSMARHQKELLAA